jgi:hypothetical protein
MTCADIELVIARAWGYRKNCIVPNVSWGMGLHECDLLIVSSAGYATEIEIKVSASDLKKDATKSHQHLSTKIKCLFFAVPEKLLKYTDLIPERAGIICVRERKEVPGMYYQEIIRPAQANKQARAFTQAEMLRLYRLGALRIWDLKQKVRTLAKENKLMRQSKSSI